MCPSLRARVQDIRPPNICECREEPTVDHGLAYIEQTNHNIKHSSLDLFPSTFGQMRLDMNGDIGITV